MRRSQFHESRIPVRMAPRIIYHGRHQVNLNTNKDGREERGVRKRRAQPYSREERSERPVRKVTGKRLCFDSLPMVLPSSTCEIETYGLNIDFLRELRISLPLKSRIFICNIPKNVSVGQIYEICSLAGSVTWLDVFLDQEDKTIGRAVCEYSHPIEAVQAVSMLCGQLFFNNTLLVKMDDRERRSGTREGELPAGLSGIGLGLGLNGAPLNLMNSSTQASPF